MKCKFERFNINVPTKIGFKEDGNTLIVTMQEEGINCNMQENMASFEAWALVAKARGYKQIKLEKEKNIKSKSKGHYNRFLYRAYCFNELFDWFILSNELKEETKEFYNNYFKSKKLVYNIPYKDGEKKPAYPEAIMENFFVDKRNIQTTNKLLKTNINQFYSQLPVGTFLEKKANENRVFTGGKSAIDFWGMEDETLNVIELKAGKNKSLGVLSELFFYVCLMRDFYINRYARDCKGPDKRGFEIIRNTKIKKVYGTILTENVHPELEKAFKELKKASQIDKYINFNEVIHYSSSELLK